MAAPRYVKARLTIGVALAASVIGGSAYFAQASPGASTAPEPVTVAANVPATIPTIPASQGSTAAAPQSPGSAPVKPKATATAKRSRAS